MVCADYAHLTRLCVDAPDLLSGGVTDTGIASVFEQVNPTHQQHIDFTQFTKAIINLARYKFPGSGSEVLPSTYCTLIRNV